MKKAEIIILTLSIIAIGLNLLLIPGAGVLTALTLSTLSVIYMYFGFAFFNDIRLRNIFKKEAYGQIDKLRIIGAIGTGFALSLTIIGLLFKFQFWPGADYNLGAGLFGLLIVTIVGAIKYSKNKSEYYKRIFTRVALFGGLGLILILIPNSTWIEIKYRNHPAYADALKKSIAAPEDKELWEKVEVERKRMNEENQ